MLTVMRETARSLAAMGERVDRDSKREVRLSSERK